MAQKIWTHCEMSPFRNLIWLRSNRLVSLVMNCRQPSRQTYSALGFLRTHHAGGTAAVLREAKVKFSSSDFARKIRRAFQQLIRSPNGRSPPSQFCPFPDCREHQRGQPRVYGKCSCQGKCSSLRKLQGDNGCDLQGKTGYKTNLTVYLERSYRLLLCVCVCVFVHMAGASYLK